MRTRMVWVVVVLVFFTTVIAKPETAEKSSQLSTPESSDQSTDATRLREQLYKLGYIPGSVQEERKEKLRKLDEVLKRGQRLRSGKRLRSGAKKNRLVKLGPKSQRVIIQDGGGPLIITEEVPLDSLGALDYDYVDYEVDFDDLPRDELIVIDYETTDIVDKPKKHYQPKHHKKHYVHVKHKPYGHAKHYGHKKHTYGHAKDYGHSKHTYGHEKHHYNHRKPSHGYGYEEPHYKKPHYGYEQESYGYEKEPYGYEKEPYGYQKEPYGYEKEHYGYEKEPYGYAPEYRHIAHVELPSHHNKKEYEYYVHVKSGSPDLHPPTPPPYYPEPPPPPPQPYHHQKDPYAPHVHHEYKQEPYSNPQYGVQQPKAPIYSPSAYQHLHKAPYLQAPYHPVPQYHAEPQHHPEPQYHPAPQHNPVSQYHAEPQHQPEPQYHPAPHHHSEPQYHLAPHRHSEPQYHPAPQHHPAPPHHSGHQPGFVNILEPQVGAGLLPAAVVGPLSPAPVDGEAVGEDLVGGFHHHTGPYGVMGFYANFFDDGERITIGQPG